jgi:hypothetical protein
MEPSGGTGMEYNKRLPVHFVGAFATTVDGAEYMVNHVFLKFNFQKKKNIFLDYFKILIFKINF